MLGCLCGAGRDRRLELVGARLRLLIADRQRLARGGELVLELPRVLLVLSRLGGGGLTRGLEFVGPGRCVSRVLLGARSYSGELLLKLDGALAMGCASALAASRAAPTCSV